MTIINHGALSVQAWANKANIQFIAIMVTIHLWNFFVSDRVLEPDSFQCNSLTKQSLQIKTLKSINQSIQKFRIETE